MHQKKQIPWLDTAKGASIVLVVWLHAGIITLEYGIPAEQLWIVNELLRPVRIPVFFLISGMLAGGALRKAWPDFLASKILFFVYLLVLWAAIRHLFFWSFRGIVPEPFGATDHWIVLTALWAPANEIWFLWALALYFLVARAARGAALWIVLATASVLSIATFAAVVDLDEGVYRNTIVFAPFFFLGIAGRAPIIRFVEEARWTTAVAAISAFAALYYVGTYTGGIVAGLAGFCLCLVGIAVGCILARVASGFPFLQAPLSFIGRRTLPIYVAHMMPMAVMAVAWRSLAGQGRIMEMLAVPFLTATPIALALGFWMLVHKRPLAWLYALPAFSREDAALQRPTRASPGAGR